jgi:hypothetical protein
MLIVGRALQGAGAVSAAVTALLADLTRDEVRTKAMAAGGHQHRRHVRAVAGGGAAAGRRHPPVGPVLADRAAGRGGVVVVLRATPDEPARHKDEPRGRLQDVWLHPTCGGWTWACSCCTRCRWPCGWWCELLVGAGLPKANHWQLYLPAVLASFVLMGGLFSLERRGYLRAVLRGGIALLLLVQLALLWLAPRAPGLWTMGWVMFFFFVAFNLIEASQPSLISRLAPANARGAALGVYNTLQSLGLLPAAPWAAGCSSTAAMRPCWAAPRCWWRCGWCWAGRRSCRGCARPPPRRRVDPPSRGRPAAMRHNGRPITTHSTGPTPWPPSTKSSSSATWGATPRCARFPAATRWPT